MEAINIESKTDKWKISILLTVAGPEPIDVFNNCHS